MEDLSQSALDALLKAEWRVGGYVPGLKFSTARTGREKSELLAAGYVDEDGTLTQQGLAEKQKLVDW